MSDRTVITEAGNVLPAALAVLKSMGYKVSAGGDGSSIEASSEKLRLVAEHPLALLGLVKLHELRGTGWHPSDAEVEDFLSLLGEVQYSERADVWEEQGAVHIKCATSHGDPVELSTEQAKALVAKLEEAITKAEKA